MGENGVCSAKLSGSIKLGTGLVEGVQNPPPGPPGSPLGTPESTGHTLAPTVILKPLDPPPGMQKTLPDLHPSLFQLENRVSSPL